MMTCSFRRSSLVLSSLVASTAMVSAQTSPITIRVDATAKGTSVSPYLYGVFFEEINHAGDGGLYAELVRNRSFEEGKDGKESWTLDTPPGAKAEWVQDGTHSLNANNTNSLRLSVTANPKEITLVNGGYWGISLKKGKSYDLSLYTSLGKGNLRISEARLVDKNGVVQARATLPAPGTVWKKSSATLTAKSDVSGGKLVLAIQGTGTLYCDMVSLFPHQTFRNRSNGLREDLATTVAAMRPAFMRFPGGCFVEGFSPSSAFRWKNTIGDTAARKTRGCLWGYLSTEGLGYHEYLQFCEDIGATPLLVVNCGMRHDGVIPMSEMGPWVQDALDAIEYANGPATSTWGKKRAQNGHPKPFGLKFIEIGNENGGPAYNERFALFVDAIRKKYPNLSIIANLWGGTPTSRKFDLVDEHYYNDPNFFFDNANKYDSYSRSGPKVYVGEYAVTNKAGTGNLHAALGEAAFMIGMERNADVVTMASYAPLFVRTENRAWNPDAIVFNSDTAYGTPSYYVQKLFGNNRPVATLPTKVSFTPQAAARVRRTPTGKGAVGVGTWETQAEFKDITVTGIDGKKLSITNEKALGGKWNQHGSVYSQTEGGADKRLILGDPSWTDYTLSLKARKTGGAEGFLILYHVQDEKNYSWWNIGGWQNAQHGIERSTDGNKSTPNGMKVPGHIETGKWYDIRIEIKGGTTRCYLDNRLVHTYSEQGTPLFHATVGKAADGGYIVKVVNGTETPQKADLQFAGWKGATGQVPVTQTVLTGDALDQENSFTAPQRISPTTKTVRLPVQSKASGATIPCTFAPRSVTLLRFR